MRAGLGWVASWRMGLGVKGHGSKAMGQVPWATGEIEGGVDGQWMGGGVAVVHVSRLYAKGSSHFDPRRVMRRRIPV